jgi:hypothetical protein
MDLTPYVDNLRRELAVAAEIGGEDARALAERLIAPLESATRLALLDALSAAAGEITRDLVPGSVDVRLRGRDLDFVVTSPPADQALDEMAGRDFDAASAGVADSATAVGPPPLRPPPEAEEGGTSRITLRLPEHLKPRIDEAAGRAGLSVNAWLVRAVAAALDPDEGRWRADRHEGRQAGRRYTGWVR